MRVRIRSGTAAHQRDAASTTFASMRLLLTCVPVLQAVLSRITPEDEWAGHSITDAISQKSKRLYISGISSLVLCIWLISLEDVIFNLLSPQKPMEGYPSFYEDAGN